MPASRAVQSQRWPGARSKAATLVAALSQWASGHKAVAVCALKVLQCAFCCEVTQLARGNTAGPAFGLWSLGS
eukprot:5703352-Alexandrium_andersonii.AAC.1